MGPWDGLALDDVKCTFSCHPVPVKVHRVDLIFSCPQDFRSVASLEYVSVTSVFMCVCLLPIIS
jgi:hypothetical protein